MRQHKMTSRSIVQGLTNDTKPGLRALKQMKVPMAMSIWDRFNCMTESPRFSRTQRGDAKSGSVFMDRISPYVDTSLEKFATTLNKRMEARNSGVLPSRIDVLRRLGIPELLVCELIDLARDGVDELDVIIALLLMLADAGQLAPLSNDNLQTVKDLSHRISTERLNYLQNRLRDVVKHFVETEQYSDGGSLFIA